MATSSLGRLTLDLLVKHATFTEGMDKAERSTKKSTKEMSTAVQGFKAQVLDAFGGTQIGSVIDNFTTRLSSVKGGVLVAGAALAGMAVGGVVVAVGALSKMAIETAKADTQLLMLANRANTSVQSFQVLEHAAAQFGVSQDQLGSILADTQEKLGEFNATEGGGAADFFDALKNNTKMTEDQIRSFAKTLQGKDGIEAIQAISNKLDELDVSKQERRFVFESLASDLGNLAPLFSENGKLLDQYGEALEEAGVIKTKESIEQSRILAAQTQAVQTRFEGFKSQLASQMMPVLNNLLTQFMSGTTEGKQFGTTIGAVGTIAKGVGAVIIGVAGAIEIIINQIRAFLAQSKNIGRTAMNVWNAEGFTGKSLALVAGITGSVSIAQDSITSSFAILDKTVRGAAGMFDSAAPKLDNLANLYYQTGDAANNASQGLKINTKQADENAKASEKAANAAAKHANELKRLQDQQQRDREQISKTYATDYENINFSEEDEAKRIVGANFSSAEQTRYLGLAKMRFDGERAEYFKSLNLELFQYQWTEEKKLEYAYQMDREIAENDIKTSGVVKESKLKFLDEQYAYQKKQLEISQNKELLGLKRNYMSAENYAREYYSLVRDEIINTSSYSQEMKDAMILNSYRQQSIDENAEREQVWSDYQSMTGSGESPYQQDMDLLAKAREQMLITEEEYQRDRLALQMGYGGQYLGALSGMFGAMLGESSSTYQALFFAQKSFFLAQAGMNVWKSASDAYANEPGTWYQKAGAAAMATIESGSFLSLIEAATPMGMAHDGIDNIPKEGTWLLDKGERVVDSRTNADLKGMIANQKTGSGDIYINVDVTDSGVSSGGSRENEKQLGQMIGNAVRAVIRQEQRQGGLLAR